MTINTIRKQLEREGATPETLQSMCELFTEVAEKPPVEKVTEKIVEKVKLVRDTNTDERLTALSYEVDKLRDVLSHDRKKHNDELQAANRRDIYRSKFALTSDEVQGTNVKDNIEAGIANTSDRIKQGITTGGDYLCLRFVNAGEQAAVWCTSTQGMIELMQSVNPTIDSCYLIGCISEGEVKSRYAIIDPLFGSADDWFIIRHLATMLGLEKFPDDDGPKPDSWITPHVQKIYQKSGGWPVIN